jgi:chaperone required for assembly of F1-ATPase
MGKQNNTEDIVFYLNKMQKGELIERLVSFVCHDTILYLPENPFAKKYLAIVNTFLGAQFCMCDTIATDECNVSQKDKIERYLEKLAFSKLVGLYLMATELRSVLLGVLLAEKQLSIKEAFECSFFEELEEQKKWGKLEEIKQKHTEVMKHLEEALRGINA